MPKADIELVKMILQRNELDTRKVSQILEDLNTELQSEEVEKPPAVKKQFVILISDPEGTLPERDYVGWVLQIPEDDSLAVVEERLHRSAYAFNQSPKGRRMPVKTIGECCEVVSARYTKEEQVWIKTKEPVLVLNTNNQIPFDQSGE